MYKLLKWCISSLRSVSAWVNARGYPCAKGYNSSASQWLSGEQVRLCPGHPKVHLGTIVAVSWRGVGVHGMVLLAPSLIHDFSQEIRCWLKLMAQHDKWKSPSVVWWISFTAEIWNEHTTTEKIETEDPRFYRQQRRAARQAQCWLAHGGCKRVRVSRWRVG